MIPLIYSVSYFNAGVGALFGGLSPPKPSRGDESGDETQHFSTMFFYAAGM